ncbi:MAG: GNAT family N-acetyltransferase [Sphingobacteriaceae bacterium]
MHSIEQIRHELTWALRHEVMYPDMDLEAVKLPDDEEGIHFGLFDHNRLISVISTFQRDDEMQFRKFATRNEFQGQGYGKLLFEYVLDFARSKNIKRIWLNARTNVSALYERYSFHKTEQTYFKDGYDFVIMELYL